MNDSAQDAAGLQRPLQPGAPLGHVEPTADRDQAGRFVRGNKAALVVGHRSAAFWAAVADVRREIAAAVIADAGHNLDDAPRALRLAADSLAQAALLQASAFERLCESAGPMTTGGRTRRAYSVWLSATDRLEHHLRLVGLRRVPRPAPTLAEYLGQRTREQAAASEAGS
jgi:hypothetical protein